MKEEWAGRRRGSGADEQTGGGGREQELGGGEGVEREKKTGGWSYSECVVCFLRGESKKGPASPRTTKTMAPTFGGKT